MKLYVPGGSCETNIRNPLFAEFAPNIAPTSGREMPYVAAPTNIGDPPDVGNAQTCTASTPVPLAAFSSSAHPASLIGSVDVTPFDGVSIDMNGVLGAEVVKTRSEELATTPAALRDSTR